MRFSAATTADRLLPERLALRARPLLDQIDAVLFSPDGRGEAGRMSLVAFLVRLVSAAIAFVSQVFLARWMGDFEYGIFVLVWVTMVIAGSVSCLGFHTSVVRFIPEYRETGRMAELRAILVGSRLFVLIASTVFAGAGILALRFSSGTIEPYYVAPFILGLVCLPMIALGDVLEGLARAYSWPFSALSPTYLLRPVLILLLLAVGLSMGYEVHADTALVATILATYATTIAQLVFVTGRIRERVPQGPLSFQWKPWFIVSLPIFLSDGFFFLLTNADVLLVGVFLPPEEVAVYFATVKTLVLVHFVYFAVKAGVAQRYAAIAHGDPGQLGTFARETVAWTFWPSLLMAAVVLILGEPMLMLFGPGFTDGFPLLFLLVVGVVVRAAVGPCESLLSMSGNQNVCALIYGLTLALNVALSVMLIPMLGLWGAALATTLSVVFEASVLSFTVWRRLGIPMLIGWTPRPLQQAAS